MNYKIWDKQNNSWNDSVCVLPNGEMFDLKSNTPMDKQHFIICPYIGQNDKNENPIFCGDVLKFNADFDKCMRNSYIKDYFEKFNLKEAIMIVSPLPEDVLGFEATTWFVKADGSLLNLGEYFSEYSKSDELKKELSEKPLSQWEERFLETHSESTTNGFSWAMMYCRKLNNLFIEKIDVGGIEVIGNIYSNPQFKNRYIKS